MQAIGRMTGSERQDHPVRSTRAPGRGSPPDRRRLRALLLCLALLLFPVISAGQQNSPGEYELKAAILFKLTRFVQWPPSAYTGSRAPTVMCILGRDPFGGLLESLAPSQTVNGRPVQVLHLRSDKDIRACHVLFVSSSNRRSVGRIFSALRGSSVLTVGETTEFAASGGMIQFALEQRHVTFEINLDAASRADLKISSRLLALARVVKDHGRGSAESDPIAPRRPPFAAGSQLGSPARPLGARQLPTGAIAIRRAPWLGLVASGGGGAWGRALSCGGEWTQE
ncbi:MAG TPA: YfiR family protein [Candidatus Acidoferrales bacterium]|nr:YfiR family protein [Candidatus Acidoferrales bacterium]